MFEVEDNSVVRYSERAFFLLFLMLFAGSSVVGWTKTVITLVFGVFGLSFLGDFIYYSTLSLLTICAIPFLGKHLRAFDIAFFFFFFIAYDISLVSDGNASFFKESAPQLFSALPLYYIGVSYEFGKKLKLFGLSKSIEEWMLYISVIGIIIMIGYQFYYSYVGRIMPNEVSSWSTGILIYVCFVLIYSFEKRSLLCVFTAIAGIVALVSYGIRANVLASICAVLFCVWRELNKAKHKVVFIVLFAIALFLLLRYFEDIMVNLGALFSRFGFSSRILVLISDEDLLHLSSREIFYQRSFEYIRQRFVTGYGLFGDRAIFGGMGEYTHNIFLEVLFDFGVIIGGIVIIFFVLLILKSFIRTKKHNAMRNMLVLLFCREIIVLLFSGSYLVEGYFFMLIGLCVSINRKDCASERARLVSFDLTSITAG